MTGFELRTSGIGSDRSTNWATTIYPLFDLLWAKMLILSASLNILNNAFVRSSFSQGSAFLMGHRKQSIIKDWRFKPWRQWIDFLTVNHLWSSVCGSSLILCHFQYIFQFSMGLMSDCLKSWFPSLFLFVGNLTYKLSGPGTCH